MKFIPASLTAFGILCLPTIAQEAAPAPKYPAAATLFQNVRVFGGESDTHTVPRHGLVRGNKIGRISDQSVPADRRADTLLIK